MDGTKLKANASSNRATDKGQLVSMVEKTAANCFETKEALADTGYYSQSAGPGAVCLARTDRRTGFGIIKEVMRFRQFLMRGTEKVAGEWNLVCCSYNIKRLFNLVHQPAAPACALAAENRA